MIFVRTCNFFLLICFLFANFVFGLTFKLNGEKFCSLEMINVYIFTV